MQGWPASPVGRHEHTIGASHSQAKPASQTSSGRFGLRLTRHGAPAGSGGLHAHDPDEGYASSHMQWSPSVHGRSMEVREGEVTEQSSAPMGVQIEYLPLQWSPSAQFASSPHLPPSGTLFGRWHVHSVSPPVLQMSPSAQTGTPLTWTQGAPTPSLGVSAAHAIDIRRKETNPSRRCAPMRAHRARAWPSPASAEPRAASDARVGHPCMTSKKLSPEARNTVQGDAQCEGR